MQNQTTLHAPVALLALAAVSTALFWPDGVEALCSIDCGPLGDGICALGAELEKVLHADFWLQLVGASDVNELHRR